MTTSPDILHSVHIGIGVLTAAALALLAMMFWNSSLTNRDQFTTSFLKLLTIISWARVFAIISTMYRSARILAEDVPVDANVVSYVGRGLELAAYCVMIRFMLRPQTRKALNGASN